MSGRKDLRDHRYYPLMLWMRTLRLTLAPGHREGPSRAAVMQPHGSPEGRSGEPSQVQLLVDPRLFPGSAVTGHI